MKFEYGNTGRIVVTYRPINSHQNLSDDNVATHIYLDNEINVP